MSVSHTQLKAFHAVAQHGSFTKAAERLFLTQPAISDQVRKLEERFGVLLFHRNKRSVRLTDLGEINDHVRPEEIAAIREQRDALRQRVSGCSIIFI